jgi:hypothetical protein
MYKKPLTDDSMQALPKNHNKLFAIGKLMLTKKQNQKSQKKVKDSAPAGASA